ncbi:MAG: ABC transporter permease, partial [Candidatus Promineifilaceae bacterium]|nr:ABC transporter permease [Candidatus Promineifilaceae bacterium]
MSVFSALRPRWRKVLADLWDNKLRTFLVVASIAVGVFAVGTIGHSFAIISQDMNVSYAAAQPANIEIWTDSFNEELVEDIAAMPGVAEAEGRHVFPVRLSRDGSSWKSHELIALKDYEDSNIYLRTPAEGEHVPGRHELILEKNVFTNSDFQLGEQLYLQPANGSFERLLPVTGVVLDQAGGGGDYTSQPRVYATMDTLEWVGQPRSFNRLLIRVSGDNNDLDHIETVAQAVEDRLERSGRFVSRTRLNKTDEHPMASIVNAMLAVQAALAVMIMLLSSTLIANTLNALLSQHIRQIGVMKLVGARSRQIMAMYLVLILSFGIIASIVAIPLGVIAGNGLAESLSSQLNIVIQGFRVVPQIVIMQILGALLIPLVAGIIPVKNGAGTTVRRAISISRAGEGGETAGWLTRMSEWLHWISRPIMLSIRNTFRRKGRLSLTLFTLIMGGAVFIAVFNVQASLYRFVDQLSRHFIADVMVSFERPYRIARVQQTLAAMPIVERVEGWTATTAEILNADDSVARNLTIIAPPADTPLVEPELIAGRWIEPGEERTVAVGDAIYEVFPGFKPGDTLRLNFPGDEIEEWVVSGIFRFSNQLTDVFGYADYDIIARMQTSPDQAP